VLKTGILPQSFGKQETIQKRTGIMTTIRSWFAICGLFFAVNSYAQTILSGNISGTWSPSGNPYVISANATVPTGQTLTIQPGVIVWIGQGNSMTVNGGIQAVGTSSQHIIFQAPIGSQYWSTISVPNGGGNFFDYCDFLNATNALAFIGSGRNQLTHCTFTNVMGTALAFNPQSYEFQSFIQVLFTSFQNVRNGIGIAVFNGNASTLTANIVNCSFSNCWGTAVSGIGNGGNNLPGTIVATIEDCSISSVGSGCSFNLSGVNTGGDYNANGTGNVQLFDNLFNNVTNSAISLTQNGNADSSPATIVNNIILNASNAVVIQDPWDATVLDNIFVGCTNAVTDTGTLSRNIEFNDFCGNTTNFIGYTSDYGTVIITNRNGTPCDLLFNIYQDPLFVAPNNFTLQMNSPCINAGTPNPVYMNTSFPPSQGTAYPDLGIYGGPVAANWLPVTPSPPAPIILAASPAVRLTCSTAVPAGTYQLQTSEDLTNWSDYGSQFYLTATSNLVEYVDATNGAGFFRLQSQQP
jgi:hypothetical protein